MSPAVQVTIQDLGGNAVTSASDSISLSLSVNPSGATLTGGGATATTSGVATFPGLSIDKAGTGYRLLATSVSGLTEADSASFDVSAGSAVGFVVTGFPSPAIAGTSGSFTVTALDANGNVATGFRGEVAFSSTDSQAALPAAYTFTASDSGVRSFQANLKTAGTHVLQVDDTASVLPQASQTGIQVVAAAPAALAVSGIPSPIGLHAPADLVVEAKDAFGNLSPGYLGEVHFSSSDFSALLPAPYTFTASDAGRKQLAGAVRFATEGTHSVTATDLAGLTGVQSNIVVLGQVPPVIVEDANRNAAVGQPYVYNARRAVTALGPGTITFDRCGGPAGFAVEPTSGAVRWTPATAGPAALCVLARNAFGEDQYSFTVNAVTRTSTPVIAHFSASPKSGVTPLAVAFDASLSSGDAGALPLLYHWDFGDGHAPSTELQPSHTYLVPSTYTVRLTVLDAFGGSAEARDTIQVQHRQGNTPPRARVIATQTTGRDTLSVDFSCDCQEGSTPIAAYRWDFGDGQLAFGPTSSHTYSPGRYRARLTVVDQSGLGTHDEVEIVVSQGDRLPPTCRAYATPTAGEAPLAVRFGALFFSEAGTISDVRWSFGTEVVSGMAAVDRRYELPGRYLAQLTITDDAGLTCQDELVIHALGPDRTVSPDIVSAPRKTAQCGVPYLYSDEGLAAEGSGPLIWAAATAPSGMTLDHSGAIQWTPHREQAGLHRVVLEVRNGAGVDLQEFDIEVVCGSPRVLVVGCGCASTEFVSLLPFALLLLTLRRRRPRGRGFKGAR